MGIETPSISMPVQHKEDKKNQIVSIRDEDDHLWETPESIGGAFVHYFSTLFTSEIVGDLAACLRPVEKKVTPEMNFNLLREFTKEVVAMALQQMSPLKAPGPDGFSASFYQQNWETIGDEVSSVVLDALNFGFINKEINSTYIALIPKVQNPIHVTEFRPISLYNVMYKLISKTLANRLKIILPQIISQNQSAFIPGRLITNNILVAYETLHTMHARMWGKEGYMAIDMSKAYDRVE